MACNNPKCKNPNCTCGDNCTCDETHQCGEGKDCGCKENEKDCGCHKCDSEAEMENEKHRHPCHKQEIPRLNRVIGQLEGVKKMIEELRYCPDILIQLRAARSAIRAVESNILKTHLQSCVAQSFASEEDKEQKLNELKELFDRFES